MNNLFCQQCSYSWTYTVNIVGDWLLTYLSSMMAKHFSAFNNAIPIQHRKNTNFPSSDLDMLVYWDKLFAILIQTLHMFCYWIHFYVVIWPTGMLRMCENNIMLINTNPIIVRIGLRIPSLYTLLFALCDRSPVCRGFRMRNVCYNKGGCKQLLLHLTQFQSVSPNYCWHFPGA